MTALFWLIGEVLTILRWIILIYIIVMLLIQFGVINSHQPFVQTLMRILGAVAEPILSPIRTLLYRLLPSTGGIDLSPIVALLLLQFLQIFLLRDVARAFGVY